MTRVERYDTPILSSSPRNPPKPIPRDHREQPDVIRKSRSFDEDGLMMPPLPNPDKEYGRKPRRKTRLDRYEPKSPTKDCDKGDRKRKRNPKTGHRRLSKTMLGEHFKAANVKQDRLTLPSSHGLGLFQKGKTSSPKRRRELPDLSFSEMGFLAKRKDHETQKAPARGSGNEISHYFSELPPIKNTPSAEPEKDKSISRQKGRQNSNNCFPAPDAPEPARSKPKNQPNMGPFCVQTQPTSTKASIRSSRTREHGPRSMKSDIPKPSSDHSKHAERSTTYYTWSESDQRVAKGSHSKINQTTCQEDAGEASPRSPSRRDSRIVISTPDCGAGHILSQNVDLANPPRANTVGRTSGYLTLDDLHDLADGNAPGNRALFPAKAGPSVTKVDDNFSNAEGREELELSVEEVPPAGQAEASHKTVTSDASKGVHRSRRGSSGVCGVGMADHGKGVSKAVSTLQCRGQVAPNSAKQKKSGDVAAGSQNPQTHRMRFGSVSGTLNSWNGNGRNPAVLRRSIIPSGYRPLFLNRTTQDIVKEHQSVTPEPENIVSEVELDRTRLSNSEVDLLGLDAFDREVLETGYMGATFYADGDTGDYSHDSLFFLPSTASRPENELLELFPPDSPYGMRISGENNSHPLMTHSETGHTRNLPGLASNLRPFGQDDIDKHFNLEGYGGSTLAHDNPPSEFWNLGSRGKLDAHIYPRVAQMHPRDGLPRRRISNERRDDRLNSGEMGEREIENGPIAFWRPNRLY
ncbi:hypothetical protein FQN54_002496 [Arachnomyces sp. PD_36]|nr:hypothetical protein FQN54_002496 [Arachnomyces sp. PD_36]